MFQKQPDKFIKIQVKEFDVESLQAMLPVKMNISEDMLQQVNNMINDEELQEQFKQNLVDFSSVLSSTRTTFQDYINAVKFVSYILMDNSATKSYMLAFPDRVKRLEDKYGSNSYNQITVRAQAYKHQKIVRKVLEQTLVPAYVYNTSLFQEAINTQASIMRDTNISSRDRVAAAESVLKYTQIPEKYMANSEQVSEQGMSVIEKLAESLKALTNAQKDSIVTGNTAKTIAQGRLWEGEVCYEDN